MTQSAAIPRRIAILGCPVRPDVPWTPENLDRLKTLGFDTIQLNIAWGSRPGDEPLNLEDVVELADLLRADQENCGVAEPFHTALADLCQDLDGFLAKWLRPDAPITFSRGDFTVTSR